jgi:trigger factor
MKVHVEDVSPIKKTLSIEVEAEQVKKDWETVVKALNKKVKLKGFRPGKVPLSILLKYYGPQIEEETISRAVNRSYPEALRETGVVPLSWPELDYPPLDKDAPFIYKATVELKPEIHFSDYKGIPISPTKIQVSEEEVDRRIEAVRLSHGELVPLDQERPLRKGDFAVIDYRSFVEGQELPGGTAQNFDLEVGSQRFHPDFEKELEGLRKGEEKEFEIEYPPDFGNQALAGKKVRFQVTLQDIKERRLPELDDAFAQSLGKEFSGLEDLRRRIRQDLEEEEKRKAEAKVREELIEGLLARTEFETPEVLIREEMEAMMARLEQDLRRQGLTWEKAGLDPDELKERFRPTALKTAQRKLVLERVAELEGLEVTDEEVDGELQRIASGVNQSVTLIREIYQKNRLLPELKRQLLEEKTLNFLKEHATLKLEENEKK